MLIIDFETYSPEPIDNGVLKYANAHGADIICCAYKLNDNPTKLWLPGQRVPDIFKTERLYAHNALFDYVIWNTLGQKYGFPARFLDQWEDTMALCRRYTLPAKLVDAGKVLQCNIQKNTRGAALIRKICVGFPRPAVGKDFSHAELEEFYLYCIQDVDSTYELLQKLPAKKLNPDEYWIWLHTQKINLRGLPIDYMAVEVIAEYIKAYKDELTDHLSQLTDGKITKITQAQRIKEFCGLPNLQKDTVDAVLNNPAAHNLNINQITLLELRKDIGSTATAKYKKLRSLVYEGRVYENLMYYGANTGRFGGRSFQLHNLPRAQAKDPESLITDFLEFRYIRNPLLAAKSLIRSMIKAPSGHKIMVADYHAIENFILLWICEEYEVLKRLYAGADQYIDMATKIFGVEYDKVDKSQRQIGKVVILGAGYTLGGKGLKAHADSWGLPMTLEEAFSYIQIYRQAHPKVCRTWRNLTRAARAAVANPGTAFATNRCKFKVVRDWLVLTLPSGRNIFYKDPELGSRGAFEAVKYQGINPYSKKWGTRYLTAATIIENIVQATARDCLCEGLKNIETRMPEVDIIGHVHDEIISVISDEWINENTLSRFERLMCILPPWAEGLKLTAEGYIGRRYKKL